MKTLKNLLTVGAATFGTLFTNVSLYAQESGILQEADRTSVNTTTFLREGIINVVNYFLGFLGLITVLIIIYNGVMVVTQQGDDARLGAAGKNIGFAIVGILIIFLAFAIVNFIIPAVTGVVSQ